MKALIAVDIQNDFLPGGALAVPQGDAVVGVANDLMPDYEIVVATQDWHPPDHGSFAANHPGKEPGDVVELAGVEQILWPVHCVEESRGAEFAPGLDIDRIHEIVHKGRTPPWTATVVSSTTAGGAPPVWRRCCATVGWGQST